MNELPIIDTHQHLITPDKYPYGWTDELPALLGKAFALEDYRRAAEGAGIASTLFMESSPDDPHWLQEARDVGELANNPAHGIRGLVLNCRPEKEDFERQIDELRAVSPRVAGFRRILHVMPDDFSDAEIFVQNIRTLGRKGLSFDLCFLARQLPAAVRLARRCPETQLILDHCGVPPLAGADLEAWRCSIRELASLPNVACKISGVLAYCAPGEATLETVRPCVEHCLECFGWDRVVWGSDWPVVNTASDLATWVSVSRQLVASCSPSEQRRLFSENAEGIYHLKP